ncbi:Asp23/Gls24 family envelope stress response protein [Sesbania bispinosa]|nr:Asp23/Gls24 family envelope stress response protein [Sesbania bispinosa]
MSEGRDAGSSLSIEQMAGGSGQADVRNVESTVVTGDMPNVYSEVLNEIVEFRHDMEDEYVSDELESLSGSDGECDVPREEPPPPAAQTSAPQTSAPQASASQASAPETSAPQNSTPQTQEPLSQATANGPVQVPSSSLVLNGTTANQQTGSNADKVQGSQQKRQRKNSIPRQLIPKSVQKERLQKKCINKGPSQIQNTQPPIENQLNLIDALTQKLISSETEMKHVSESPPANCIQTTKDVQKVMGLARQVFSGQQPDWNEVTKEMPISPDLLHTYNTVQQLSNFAKALTSGEGVKSHEVGGTKLTDPFIPPQSDGDTAGVIPTQTSGTDN